MMLPKVIRIENENDFSAAADVGVPIGDVIARYRTACHEDLPSGSAGIWECSPGRFRRQVSQAEYSYIIVGEGTFTVDGEEPIHFRAGDALYFPANTDGEWEICQTVKKAYFISAP